MRRGSPRRRPRERWQRLARQPERSSPVYRTGCRTQTLRPKTPAATDRCWIRLPSSAPSLPALLLLQEPCGWQADRHELEECADGDPVKAMAICGASSLWFEMTRRSSPARTRTRSRFAVLTAIQMTGGSRPGLRLQYRKMQLKLVFTFQLENNSRKF